MSKACRVTPSPQRPHSLPNVLSLDPWRHIMRGSNSSISSPVPFVALATAVRKDVGKSFMSTLVYSILHCSWFDASPPIAAAMSESRAYSHSTSRPSSAGRGRCPGSHMIFQDYGFHFRVRTIRVTYAWPAQPAVWSSYFNRSNLPERR